MLRVKIKPDCHENHRPPHRPWYLTTDYLGVVENMIGLEWFVNEIEGAKYYEVIGFMCGDSLINLKPNFYRIHKRDCEEVK